MVLDPQIERLYRQVRLVSGVGDPDRGEFCVLSLIAFLQGEAHSDRPSCVSPLVRRFAIEINDGMPNSLRYCLKPFAPRLIGTRDDADDARAQLLARSVQADILPRVRLDFSAAMTTKPSHARRSNRRRTTQLRGLIENVIRRAQEATHQKVADKREVFAAAVAELLSHCGQFAPPIGTPWYWSYAIDLLDRLCDSRVRPNQCEILCGRPSTDSRTGIQSDKEVRVIPEFAAHR